MRSKNRSNKRLVYKHGPGEKFKTNVDAYFQAAQNLRQPTFVIHSLYMNQGENKKRARRAVWTNFLNLPENTYNNIALRNALDNYLPHIVIPLSLEFTQRLEELRTEQIQSVLRWLGYV